MNKAGQLIKKYIHPFIIACMILIIIAGIVIIYNSQQKYASETWVQEYLQAYSDSLTQLDIQVLEKNLSSKIDDKINKMDFETELPEAQIMELMAMVNEELQYADFSISQEEITKLSSDIVKRIVSENTSEVYATSHKTDDLIDELEKQLLEVRIAVDKLSNDVNISRNNLSEQQIKEIAEESGLDEATVKRWIEEFNLSSLENLDDAVQELARLLDVDAITLKTLTEEAAERDDSIEYLANRLGITEEKLNNALGQASTSGNKELNELAAKLAASEADLQKRIENNMSLTTNSITSVQQQVINNKDTTDAAILANKQDMLAALTANKEETNKQINANKEYTDTVIEELQENVLFYAYDEDTNTLKLFKNSTEEGGSANEKND